MNLTTLELIRQREIQSPEPMGSYAASDVVFLLKDISHVDLEKGTGEREQAIQSGVHYSEMLPVEYQPTKEYIELFHQTLEQSAARIARHTAIVAEKIVERRGLNLVLVSLARAGTPVGILIKRYIELKYKVTIPHYSISIIRGKGMDENAILYILQQHGLETAIQFVDGWTGKGAIRKVLKESCDQMERTYGISLDDDLAVLADPGQCSGTFGTREDYLIPSACLNSTVSGLVSRTVLRDDLIGPADFHGAKWYREWSSADVSTEYVDTIAQHFPQMMDQVEIRSDDNATDTSEITWKGWQDIESIQQSFGIANINLIKPGIGETTRVLLRRVPWKILVDRLDNPDLQHIMMLARDRNVPVEVYPGLTYSCCGIIQSLGGGGE